MIEFNKHHYSNLWERQEYYNNVLGGSTDPYNRFVNMIGETLESVDTNITKFPHTIQVKQELIRIIMLAQAHAIRSKLDVSSLKPPKQKHSLIKRIFKRN